MAYQELDDGRARRLINAEQVFDAYRVARSTLRDRFTGSMARKSVDGRSDLYRNRKGVWKSLGPRSAWTEALHQHFIEGRARARERRLLYDARASLKLVVPDAAASGIVGVLRKVDASFEMRGRRSCRAANRDGCIVDPITPAPKDPLPGGSDLRIGREPDDLVAVENAGLAWLVNSPKVRVTILDLRGYPAEMAIAVPRAFALHEAWLAQRPGRNVEKRRRDRAQAEVVAELVARHLPHLTFDDPALAALPGAPRRQAETLPPAKPDDMETADRLEPDW